MRGSAAGSRLTLSDEQRAQLGALASPPAAALTVRGSLDLGDSAVRLLSSGEQASGLALATGGNGVIFGRSTNSMSCTGSACSSAYQEGALYGNPEFVQVHPTAIPGATLAARSTSCGSLANTDGV